MTKEEILLQLEYAKTMLKDYEEEDDPEMHKEAIGHYRDMIIELTDLLEKCIGDGHEKEEVRKAIEDS
jgi:hypothetical protein